MILLDMMRQVSEVTRLLWHKTFFFFFFGLQLKRRCSTPQRLRELQFLLEFHYKHNTWMKSLNQATCSLCRKRQIQTVLWHQGLHISLRCFWTREMMVVMDSPVGGSGESMFMSQLESCCLQLYFGLLSHSLPVTQKVQGLKVSWLTFIIIIVIINPKC